MLWITGFFVVSVFFSALACVAIYEKDMVVHAFMLWFMSGVLSVILGFASYNYASENECIDMASDAGLTALDQTAVWQLENAFQRKDGVWELIIRSSAENAPYLCRTYSKRPSDTFVWRGKDKGALPYETGGKK